MILAIYYLKILTMTQKMIASETEIGKKKTKKSLSQCYLKTYTSVTTSVVLYTRKRNSPSLMTGFELLFFLFLFYRNSCNLNNACFMFGL